MTKEEYEFVINRIFGGNSNGIIGDLSNGLCPILIVPLFFFNLNPFLFLANNLPLVAHLYCQKVFLTPTH